MTALAWRPSWQSLLANGTVNKPANNYLTGIVYGGSAFFCMSSRLIVRRRLLFHSGRQCAAGDGLGNGLLVTSVLSLHYLYSESNNKEHERLSIIKAENIILPETDLIKLVLSELVNGVLTRSRSPRQELDGKFD